MNQKIEDILLFLGITIIVIILYGLPLMILWNLLLHPLFGLPLIGFWQAVGLRTITSLLLSPTYFKKNNSNQ